MTLVFADKLGQRWRYPHLDSPHTAGFEGNPPEERYDGVYFSDRCVHQ